MHGPVQIAPIPAIILNAGNLKADNARCYSTLLVLSYRRRQKHKWTHLYSKISLSSATTLFNALQQEEAIPLLMFNSDGHHAWTLGECSEIPTFILKAEW